MAGEGRGRRRGVECRTEPRRWDGRSPGEACYHGRFSLSGPWGYAELHAGLRRTTPGYECSPSVSLPTESCTPSYKTIIYSSTIAAGGPRGRPWAAPPGIALLVGGRPAALSGPPPRQSADRRQLLAFYHNENDQYHEP